MNARETAKHRKHLTATADRIDAELSRTEILLQELAEPGNAESDFTEEGGDPDTTAFERDRLKARLGELRDARDAHATAIAALDDGTYGRCDGCGEPIPAERLEALPTTRVCVTCKVATGL